MTEPTRQRKTKFDELMRIGNQMSNVFFNLKQKLIIPQDIRNTMADLQREWDEARHKLFALQRERNEPAILGKGPRRRAAASENLKRKKKRGKSDY